MHQSQVELICYVSDVIQNRLRQVTMKFSLKTVNLKNVKAWDKPACYQLNVTVGAYLKILYIYRLLTKQGVNMAGYNGQIFFCILVDRDGVEVHKDQNKKRMRPISSHSDQTSLVNRGFVILLKKNTY